MGTYKKTYAELSDKEIVSSILSGNEEAMSYLLYCRYRKDLCFYAYQYYNSIAYLEDLTNELYILLKGKNADWAPLRSFNWNCKFRTWFCLVASRLFLEQKKKLLSSEEEPSPIEPAPAEKNQNLVILLEAIDRLKNELYRYILIKELEGYNHQEIASMLVQKRRETGTATQYKGKEVVPDAHYVDMNKARALKELKVQIEKIKKEWYADKR